MIHRALGRIGLFVVGIGGLTVAFWPKAAVAIAEFGDRLTHWALRLNIWGW
jgi:hypothetical protein